MRTLTPAIRQRSPWTKPATSTTPAAHWWRAAVQRHPAAARPSWLLGRTVGSGLRNRPARRPECRPRARATCRVGSRSSATPITPSALGATSPTWRTPPRWAILRRWREWIPGSWWVGVVPPSFSFDTSYRKPKLSRQMNKQAPEKSPAPPPRTAKAA